jgi:V8-like Glu-specific endopeptidase
MPGGAAGRSTGFLLAVLAIGGCVPDASEEIAARSAAIVDGTVGGPPAIVFVYNGFGGSCTGAIVAPRAVLTAKHCVQAGRREAAAPASALRVYVGNTTDSLTEEYAVSEIIHAPGDWVLEDLTGSAVDLAVLVLATPTTITPIAIAFDSPTTLFGQPVTAVGFGETGSGSSGTKYHTTTMVRDVRFGRVFVDPSICRGDSGGPLLGPDGRIYGVASLIFTADGSMPQCGVASGAYNALHDWQEFIEGALEAAGTCVPDEEVCNGLDDDCDSTIDEGCIPIGEACTAGTECVGVSCADVPTGRVCASTCDPLRPSVGCPSGFYCARSSGCEGHCLSTGTLPETLRGLGDTCTSDTECGSLFCTDPGDGLRRCMRPCRGDEGTCLDDEVCVAPLGSCGGCLDAALVAPPRGFGEPCSADGDCHSGECVDVLGRSYCSRSCVTNADCPSSGHCRDEFCVRGPVGALGSNCVTNEDCGSGTLCVDDGTRRWCTTECTGECPDGFVCTPAGPVSACAPELELLGGACTTNEECFTGLCAGLGSSMVCTRFCGPESLCPSGFICAATGDGETAVCVSADEPTTPPADDGCHTSRSAPSGLAMAAVALGLLAWRKRRR